MEKDKKSGVGDLGLSGYIKVYPSSRSVGMAEKKAAGVPATKSSGTAVQAKRPRG
jgi:hypothetical protein